MKNLTSLSLLALLISTLFLTACQSVEEQPMPQEPSEQSPQQEQVIDHGIPFSNGPTEPPEMIKGPSAPPPENTNVPAQAVTTDENIRITLPLKTD